jgi:hypothetical protein
MDMSGQVHAPADLPTGKELRYPLIVRPGGIQGRYGRLGGEENPLPLLGFEPWIVQHVPQYWDNLDLLSETNKNL